ncbi:MAG: 3-dehydroquinate synthase [Flavobacterium sp.]|nr:3-dehydroquinate synthase [Pedobacter sp.]
MDYLQQSFSINYQYRVYFTEHLFAQSNTLFSEYLKDNQTLGSIQKMLFVIDEGVEMHHQDLNQQIDNYFSKNLQLQVIPEKVMITGGEAAKNNPQYFDQIVDAINRHGIDRHSYVIAIGGGSVLDLVGYAAAVSHRGIKHIRIPTTVLSQNDSGVGVKNGINYIGKKNFLGTFSPPAAVFNDYLFLKTLTNRHWQAGISEAIKVALIKDNAFFLWLEAKADALSSRDMQSMQYLIKRCAKLHMEHIAGADPFETGSSRPLDFGHWSAHKLEQLSDFEILHGEAVSIGIALDTVYSKLCGRLSPNSCDRIIRLLTKLGLPVNHPLAQAENDSSSLLSGLQEFREHLGGRLTIMLLKEIGQGEEVHEMDPVLIREAVNELQSYIKYTNHEN